MLRSGRRGALVLLLAGALAGCREKRAAPGPPPAVPVEGSAAKTPAPIAGASFVELARRVAPSVVTIKTSARRADPFARLFGAGESPEGETLALGTGLILSPDGEVVTNDHVIARGADVRVALPGGDERPARVIGRDADLDLALLQVEATDLPAATLGDSDALEVGEWVLVIGNPFGLESTVTAGIVSAVGRSSRDLGAGQGAHQTFIQTDASINPGNSGGPVVNTAGQVVALATAIEAPGGGIGFAIPVNLVKEVLPRLRTEGRITRSWLGIFLQPVSAEVAARVGLEPPRGVLVSGVVDGSPAARAGLARGDVVLDLDGKPADDSTLPWRVTITPPGTEVKLGVWRDGKRREVAVTLEALPR
jgi:serine protease Do